jgi:hypothetical protein
MPGKMILAAPDGERRLGRESARFGGLSPDLEAGRQPTNTFRRQAGAMHVAPALWRWLAQPRMIAAETSQ